MNTQPAARPMASAIPATDNTSPAPERRRGGSDTAPASSSAITSLSARRLIAPPPREDVGPPPREDVGPPPREDVEPPRDEVGPSWASNVAAPGSANRLPLSRICELDSSLCAEVRESEPAPSSLVRACELGVRSCE